MLAFTHFAVSRTSGLWIQILVFGLPRDRRPMSQFPSLDSARRDNIRCFDTMPSPNYVAVCVVLGTVHAYCRVGARLASIGLRQSITYELHYGHVTLGPMVCRAKYESSLRFLRTFLLHGIAQEYYFDELAKAYDFSLFLAKVVQVLRAVFRAARHCFINYHTRCPAHRAHQSPGQVRGASD